MSKSVKEFYAAMVQDPNTPNVHCTYTDEQGTVIVLVEDDAPELLPPMLEEGVKIVKAPRFRAPLPDFNEKPEPGEELQPPFVAEYIPTERIRPVPGGVSVGHYKITAGTVGLWVGDTQDGGQPGLLSNNHVLAAVDSGKPGDDILQPGQADGGSRPADTVADLSRFVPMTNGGLKKVDCAIAKAKSGEVVDLRINELGYCYGIGETYSGEMIWKSGRTTGLSAGKITGNNVTVQVYYTNTQYVTYTDCFTSGIYSGPGDSGSAILDFASDRLLGLLFAGNGVQTIGCKATNIRDQLGIEILQPPEIRTSQLIDVSHWQGAIDWAKVKSRGVRGVICKVSGGDSFVDDRFASYYDGAKAAGLLVGGYIYVEPSKSADAHFQNFYRALGGRKLDMPLALDCEDTDGQSPDTITAVIQQLSRMATEWQGARPMIYTRATWWDVNVKRWSQWKDHPLWAAYWKSASALSPALPLDWKGVPGKPELWQYTVTDAAAYFGVSSTQLDLDKSYPSFEALLGEQPSQPPMSESTSASASPSPSPSPSGEPGYAVFEHFKGRVVTTVNLNIRSGPGTNFSKIGTVTPGGVVEILGTARDSSGNTWARIGYGQWAAQHWGGQEYIRYILESE